MALDQSDIIFVSQQRLRYVTNKIGDSVCMYATNKIEICPLLGGFTKAIHIWILQMASHVMARNW